MQPRTRAFHIRELRDDRGRGTRYSGDSVGPHPGLLAFDVILPLTYDDHDAHIGDVGRSRMARRICLEGGRSPGRQDPHPTASVSALPPMPRIAPMQVSRTRQSRAGRGDTPMMHLRIWSSGALCQRLAMAHGYGVTRTGTGAGGEASMPIW